MKTLVIECYCAAQQIRFSIAMTYKEDYHKRIENFYYRQTFDNQMFSLC